ncbi:MAG: PqqD family protein [Acidimicrobiales bacterium]
MSSPSLPESVRVNPSHVVHETIDGETILIHLGTGSYYSLEGSGSEIWVMLAGGARSEQVLAAASERYLGDPDEVGIAVAGLLANLLSEDLLVEGDGLPALDTPGLPPGSVSFAAPVLQVYTDMQEFMLVDPLHEVDEAAGWPHVKTD